MSAFKLYRCKPQKVQAGSIGDKPLFYSCADCDAPEADIAGFLASDPTFEHIGVIQVGGFFRLALFCEACFEKRLADEEKAGN
jgi:hypothetical protein